MKKYLLFFFCLWGVFSAYSFANWDSLVLGAINYDPTTCTLTLVRDIGGHHIDTYSYHVRGPVIINIPTQTASVTGGGGVVGISAPTFQEYVVPTCALTCSQGTSPVSTIAAFSVTGQNGAAPYTITIPGMDRNIYVLRKTAIEACLRCQEGKYWCPSANACVNKGTTCSNHQCNNDTVCDLNEGCGCSDCATKQDHCAAGLICTYDAINNNNSSCERIRCGVGKYFCPITQTCLTKGTTCSNHQCDDDAICDLNEGCGCAACDNQQDHCAETLICKSDTVNPNNSECISTECSPGTYWCSQTRTCIANTLPCNGICKVPLIMHNGSCIVDGPCLPGDLCCPVGTYFCSPQSICKAAGQVCAGTNGIPTIPGQQAVAY